MAHAIDPSGARESVVPWLLTVVHCPDATKVGIALPLERTLVIGRDGDAPLGPIADRRLSRRHASLAVSSAGATITDCDSRNGVLVDGNVTREASIATTSCVRLGDTIFVLERAHPPPRDVELPPALIGRSSGFLDACAQARRVANSELPILLVGETGVGKEAVARAMHEWSERKGSLCALGVAGLPSELAESKLFGQLRGSFGSDRDASGAFALAGTLFLEEIGELPHSLQSKLLRVIETREFTPLGATQPCRSDVRVIAAASSNPDLFPGLTSIHVPRLRDRLRDVPLLFRHFIGEIELSVGFVEAALSHPWAGNVRELRTMSQHLTTLDVPVLESTHFHEIRAELAPQRGDPMLETRPLRARRPLREELIEVLQRFDGSMPRTARHYGRAPEHIQRWIEQHGIDLAWFRARSD